jgi:tRNA G37 N-methylase Trm5
MSTNFQTAVKSSVSHEHRRDAIDRLIADDERANLALLVKMSGLRGEFRRRALEGLSGCNASETLEALSEDTTVDPSLRRRAAELC